MILRYSAKQNYFGVGGTVRFKYTILPTTQCNNYCKFNSSPYDAIPYGNYSQCAKWMGNVSHNFLFPIEIKYARTDSKIDEGINDFLKYRWRINLYDKKHVQVLF